MVYIFPEHPHFYQVETDPNFELASRNLQSARFLQEQVGHTVVIHYFHLYL